MKKTKKDKIIIQNIETGIIEHIYELHEEKKANAVFQKILEQDLQYSSNPIHEMKILNAYWKDGIPLKRI